MRVLDGKKQFEMSREALCALAAGYKKVHVDIGTGSGRYVLRHSARTPDAMVIGMDAVAAAMQPAAIRLRKAAKQGGTANAMFVVAAAEAMPVELSNMADSISVHLPWGSLRDSLIFADEAMLCALRDVAKPGAALELLLSCDGQREAGVMAQRALPAISLAYFEAKRLYWRRSGFVIRTIQELDNMALRGFDTEWAKRLAHGRARTSYLLCCRAV